jgi:hypothetical protein
MGRCFPTGRRSAFARPVTRFDGGLVAPAGLAARAGFRAGARFALACRFATTALFVVTFIAVTFFAVTFFVVAFLAVTFFAATCFAAGRLTAAFRTDFLDVGCFDPDAGFMLLAGSVGEVARFRTGDRFDFASTGSLAAADFLEAFGLAGGSLGVPPGRAAPPRPAALPFAGRRFALAGPSILGGPADARGSVVRATSDALAARPRDFVPAASRSFRPAARSLSVPRLPPARATSSPLVQSGIR